MNSLPQIEIYSEQQLVYTGGFSHPLELGRQSDGEDGLFSRSFRDGRCRLVVARREEQNVSRKHVLMEPRGPDCALLTNLSRVGPVYLNDGCELKPEASCEVQLPFSITLGTRSFRLQSLDRPTGELRRG